MLASLSSLFILDSESLLLPKKSEKKVKLKNSNTSRLMRKEFAEGSKGTENPLELLPGDLLEEPRHRSLQKTEL